MCIWAEDMSFARIPRIVATPFQFWELASLPQHGFWQVCLGAPLLDNKALE